MIIYIAGPYRGSKKQIDEHIARARALAIRVWQVGHVALCPHLNTAHFEVDAKLPDSAYLDGDLKLLARCDAVVTLNGWERSAGALEEVEFAVEHGIPVYSEEFLPPLHPTERRSPVQTDAFIDTVMQMYRTHLKKNQDYSPANILGTGEIGLATRLWDKTARLLNLLGISLSIKAAGMFVPPTEPPACEALDDTYLDLATYGVIGLLLRQGKWGR